MSEFILVFSIVIIIYHYFIYPLFISIRAELFRDPHQNTLTETSLNESALPMVSMIIAAFNEEKVIERKIINSLALDYPPEKFQLIIVSDGSDDKTHDIATQFLDKSVVALFEPERQGKSAAINRGLEVAKGEIILFSDANNDFNQDAVKQLVKHFSDDKVGAVTGAKHIYDNAERQSATGDGLYWKYEAFIKKAESRLGSITAAEGEILAVRKSLMKPIDVEVINDDAAITFDIVKSDHRVLYEPNARSEEEASLDIMDDIAVKIRMTAGGYQTMKREFSFLFPPTNWFSFCFISHKVLRWLMPHFLLFVFFFNLILLKDGSYYYLFIFQLIFYVLSAYGWLKRDSSELNKLFYLPMYFTVMNIALFLGFVKHIKGSQSVNWIKAKR